MSREPLPSLVQEFQNKALDETAVFRRLDELRESELHERALLEIIRQDDEWSARHLSEYLYTRAQPVCLSIEFVDHAIKRTASASRDRPFDTSDINLLLLVCRALSVLDVRVGAYLQARIDSTVAFLELLQRVSQFITGHEALCHQAVELVLRLDLDISIPQRYLEPAGAPLAAKFAASSYMLLRQMTAPQDLVLSQTLKQFKQAVTYDNQAELTYPAALYVRVLQTVFRGQSNAGTKSSPLIIQDYLADTQLSMYLKLYFLDSLITYVDADRHVIYHKIVAEAIKSVDTAEISGSTHTKILYQKLINKLNLAAFSSQIFESQSGHEFVQGCLNFDISRQTALNLTGVSDLEQTCVEPLALQLYEFEGYILQNVQRPMKSSIRSEVCRILDDVRPQLTKLGDLKHSLANYLCLLYQVYQYQTNDIINAPLQFSYSYVYLAYNQEARFENVFSRLIMTLSIFQNFIDYSDDLFREIFRDCLDGYTKLQNSAQFVGVEHHIIVKEAPEKFFQVQHQLHEVTQKYNALLQAYNSVIGSKQGSAPQAYSQAGLDELQRENASLHSEVTQLEQKNGQLERSNQQLTDDKRAIQLNLNLSNQNNVVFQGQLEHAQARYDELQRSRLAVQGQLEEQLRVGEQLRTENQRLSEECRAGRRLVAQIRGLLTGYEDGR